jgi:outer membrane protein assembly factor BamB
MKTSRVTRAVTLGGGAVLVLALCAGVSWSDIVRDTPRPKPAGTVKKPTGGGAGGAGDPTYRGGYARTGEGSGRIATRPKVIWTAHAGHDIGYPGQPILAAGMVFSGSADASVYAFDAKTGDERWSFKTGGGVYTSPTYADGVVYAGSYDNSVYAIDAKSGKKKWSFATGDYVEGAVCAMGDTVYVPSFDHKLYALAAAGGKKKWSYDAGGALHATPACVGDTIYVGADTSSGGVVAAVNRATGKAKWVFELEGSDYVTLAVAIAGKTGVIAGQSGKVYAFDSATGKKRWTARGPTGMNHHAVAVADGMVFSCGSDDGCVALDLADGKKKWTSSAGAVEGAPVYGDGYLYLPRNASGGSEVVALDAKNGKVVWTLPLDGSCRTSLGLFGGVLLHGTEIGNLYAIGGKGVSVASGGGDDGGGGDGDGGRGSGAPKKADPKPGVDCSHKLTKADIPAAPLRGWVDGRRWEFADGATVRKGSDGDIYLVNHPYKARCSTESSDPDDSVEVGIFLRGAGEGTYGKSDVEFMNYRGAGGDVTKDNTPNITVIVDDGDFSSGSWVSGSIAACFDDGSWIAGEFSVPGCKE